jgi:hypothetical protein
MHTLAIDMHIHDLLYVILHDPLSGLFVTEDTRVAFGAPCLRAHTLMGDTRHAKFPAIHYGCLRGYSCIHKSRCLGMLGWMPTFPFMSVLCSKTLPKLFGVQSRAPYCRLYCNHITRVLSNTAPSSKDQIVV